MKKTLCIAASLCLSLVIPAARAQQPQATAAPASAAQSPMQKTVEAYLRNLYAFGSDTVVKVGAPKDIGIEGLLEVDVAVKLGENEQSGKVYVTKDGKYMFRGEVSDLSKDPMVETRAQLRDEGQPLAGTCQCSCNPG